MLLYILRFIYLQYQNILDDISIIIPSNTFFLYTWWQQRYLISDIRWCHAVPAMRELQYLNVFWVGSMDTIHRATNGVKPAWMDSSQRGALRLIQGLKKPMALFFDFHILSVHFHNYFEELKSCTVICFCFLLLHCYCEDRSDYSFFHMGSLLLRIFELGGEPMKLKTHWCIFLFLARECLFSDLRDFNPKKQQLGNKCLKY